MLAPNPKKREPEPALNVAIALVEWRGLYAVLERDKKSGRRWTFPGGKIEKNESLIEAIVREVKEETGLFVLPYKKLGIHITHKEVRYYYAAKAIWGNLHRAEPHKFSAAEWMSAEEIIDTFGDRLFSKVREHLNRRINPQFNRPQGLTHA